MTVADLRAETMDLWVVDLETTGLDETTHVPLEVAAVNIRTGEAIEFVPFLHPADLAAADPDALRINSYFERGVYKRALDPMATQTSYAALFNALHGHRFGGANPRFDAAMLRHALGRLQSGHVPGSAVPYRPADETWHYRLADVCSYVAGALGMEPDDIPGMNVACELLDVSNSQAHSAFHDAHAAAECFRRARQIRTEQKEMSTTNA